jgi:hypothetical protein
MRTALAQIISGSSFLQHATMITSRVTEEHQQDLDQEGMLQLAED